MKLDEKLVQLRKEKGLTQLELAEAVRVSRQAVSKWESGGSLPSTENLRSLSELYEVPIDYLLNDGEKDMKAIDFLPQKTEDDPGIPCRDTRKSAMAIKWAAIALLLLVLVIFIGVIIANKNEESLHLGDVRGEEVNGLPKIEFSLEW